MFRTAKTVLVLGALTIGGFAVALIVVSDRKSESIPGRPVVTPNDSPKAPVLRAEATQPERVQAPIVPESSDDQSPAITEEPASAAPASATILAAREYLAEFDALESSGELEELSAEQLRSKSRVAWDRHSALCKEAFAALEESGRLVPVVVQPDEGITSLEEQYGFPISVAGRPDQPGPDEPQVVDLALYPPDEYPELNRTKIVHGRLMERAMLLEYRARQAARDP